MYQKLISLKQNDIGQLQYQKKQRLKQQSIRQSVQSRAAYTDSKFFSNCQTYFEGVVKDAQNQQSIAKQQRRIKVLKQNQSEQSMVSSEADEMLLLNLVVDYFRSQNLNYSYSVVMREKNMIVDEVVLKSDLIGLLDLQKAYERQDSLSVSVLHLLLEQLKRLQKDEKDKEIYLNEFGVQVEILSKSNESNNVLLSEIKLAQIRQEVEKREKKHFESQLHSFKQQQLMKVKDETLRLYDAKHKLNQTKYEERIQQLINNNQNYVESNNFRQKQTEYLREIEGLKKELRQTIEKVLQLEKQALMHDCFKAKAVKERIAVSDDERKQLDGRRRDFELALRNMDTKIEQLFLQKQKILSGVDRQTEEFVSKMNQHKENKDYMIEKIYGRIKTFELRVDVLSKDNTKLMEENRVLKAQINSLKQQIATKQGWTKQDKKPIYAQTKYPTKNAIVGVTPEEISSHLEEVDSQLSSSNLTENTEQFDQNLTKKYQYLQRVNALKSEMHSMKNKVRFLVTDFNS